MSLATIRESPGLDAYLDELEERLTGAVDAYPGLVASVGREALVAGGKRLRPLLVGRLLRGGTAYSYLPASVRRFPGPEELARRMTAAGLEGVGWRGLAGGIVALHHGRVPR